MSRIEIFSSISIAINWAKHILKTYGEKTKTESWQGVKQPKEMFEYDNLYFRARMPGTPLALEVQTQCDMPWAEDHFKERVSGQPLNPGEQYKNWPFYKSSQNSNFNDSHFRNVDEKFTHTYMERYWPCNAGGKTRNMGIRYEYGDLMDLIGLLMQQPYTRQAYLPVWFPEDTGVKHGGRVPCSIGYHFMRKGNDLNIHYMIRACDYLRHFRNDVYLTVRLCQWVLEMLKSADGSKWDGVEVGILTMDIVHFHVFYQERNLIV